MLGLFTLGAAAPTRGTTPQAGAEGQAAPSSFADLLARIAVEQAETGALPGDRLEGLAEAVQQLRTEAGERLAELFPEGEITAGPELETWAREMLTRLDDLLAAAGVSVADLSQVLAPADAAALMAGGEEGDPLVLAVMSMLGDAADLPVDGLPVQVRPGAGGAASGSAPVASQPSPPMAGQVPAVASAAGPSAMVGAVQPGQPGTDVAQQTTAATATSPNGQPEVTGAAGVQTVAISAALAATRPGTGRTSTASATDAVQAAVTRVVASPEGQDLLAEVQATAAAPLPEALRLLLAQALAAPAAKSVPAEVQAILSAAPLHAQAMAAPVVAAQVPVPPQAAPQQSFARNLAGQIRGVSFTEGTTRIELSPQGLGAIEIEISPDDQGRLRVVLRAENPAVLHAMRGDRDMLAALLRDGGTTVEDSAMSFEDLGQRRGSEQQAAGGQVSHSARTEADPEPQPEPLADASAAAVVDGRLNILT